MASLALLDLVLPYLLRGENLGAQHAALSVLRVVRWETAVDDAAVTIRGLCEFNGYARIDPSSGGLAINAGVDEGAGAFDPSRRSPVFDIRETAIEFELFVPRAPSAIIAAGESGITAAGFTPARTVLTALGAGPVSDYPSSGFTLDLILEAPSVRPPFLHPARLNDQGVLSPDTSTREVSITLPKLRFRLSHGNPNPSQLRFELVSMGVSSLDDPGDFGVAELITMSPPYAYIGGASDHVVGIGFRSATLDLSSDWTPPALKDKAQVGDDWTGLYLPEVRLFVSPDGLRNFAFECGAQQLLIGLGQTGGVWGDFEVGLVNQGSGAVRIQPRFVAPNGRVFGVTSAGANRATVRLPDNTRLIVDVVGGRVPITRSVTIGGGSAQTGTDFNIDLSGQTTVDIVIRVTDSSATAVTETLTVRAERIALAPRLAIPGPQTPEPNDATLGTTTGDFTFELSHGAGDGVTVRTVPSDDALRWSVDGGAESAARPTTDTTVAAGATHTVHARHPAGTVRTPLTFYYFFNEPPGSSIWTTKAVDEVSRNREPGGQDPLVEYQPDFDALPSGSPIAIHGHASKEVDNPNRREYNYLLANRRAVATRDAIAGRFASKNFNFVIDPSPVQAGHASQSEYDPWVTASGWTSHDVDRNRWWSAVVDLPSAGAGERSGQVTVRRAPVGAPPPTPPPDPPPPTAAPPPDWFRSAKVMVRIVDSALIALQLDCEVDFQTLSEDKHAATGQLPSATPVSRGHTLVNGTALGPDNPADGITKMRILVQTDPATSRWLTLLSVGADPHDTDGLFYFGWIPGETMPATKDLWLTMLGSYLSFWPLLAAAPPVDAVQSAVEGRDSALKDAVLAGVALATPAVIAVIPWFQVERVKVFGAEYVQNWRDPDIEASLLFDIGIDWSANILDLVIIPRDHPLAIRYKAIGLRFANHDDSVHQYSLRPVFDSSRGYTIDLASGGGLRLADPLGQILRVLGARLSKSNPLTFEIDIGLGVDLGVVSIDRASLRAYLDEPRPPELTALAASIDIPGAIVGSGYMRIGSSVDSEGHTISTIGGQIDLTLRPINLRVAAAVEIATIAAEAGGPATGVYIGLNVVLPVGIPLGTTGIGIFGFRGIFGMHYERNTAIGAGAGVPALEWLKAADGKPHLLVNPAHPETPLWVPHIDHWAFGLGMLVGTMEGGVIMNLDGTLLLELPGPRLLIMMSARIVSPPPSMDGLGQSGGVLAVIEITPEHLLIGILVHWEIDKLVKIVIPIEAMFPFGADANKWHIYLGARPDYGPSVEVDVLGVVKGTGYLMFRGDGLAAYAVQRDTLPAIKGFGIGLGVGASFTWGDVSAGLYLRIGGGMDAVIGFNPFTLAGTIWVAGELRLFIISIGADAQLTVIVAEQSGGDLGLYVHGIACGHVSFLFFEVSGCVEITISSPEPVAPMPTLVEKVSLQARSPALAQGTGVDRGVDTSLGTGMEQPTRPSASDPNLPVVPIDSIPIIGLTIPPVAKPGLTVDGLGTAVATAPGVPADGYSERSGDRYRYEVESIRLERVAGNGSVQTPAVNGSAAPVVWWTSAPTTEPSPVAQLALLTWFPTPAPKAIEKTDHLVESVSDRWGTVCATSAEPAEVLWTFKLEPLGPSESGWSLEGIAWPDAPGTVRSAPAETTLNVTEQWRTGDPSIDSARGIIPAIVVGGLVPCHTKDPQQPPVVVTVAPSVLGAVATAANHLAPALGDVLIGRQVLAATDPVRGLVARRLDSAPVAISPAFHAKATDALPALRDQVSGTEALSFEATIGHLTERMPISRAQLANLQPLHAVASAFGLAAGTPARPAATGTPATSAAAGSRCPVKALQSPLFDDGRPTLFGDPATDKWVESELAKRKIKHGPLDDVVILHTGGYVSFGVLLFVPRRLFEGKHVIVRAVAADGTELASAAVTTSNWVNITPLPGRWTDPGGPWGDDVSDLVRWGNSSPNLPVFVSLDKAPDAVRVEVGTIGIKPFDPKQDKQAVPPYYVGAVAVTTMAEVTRHDWDDEQITRDRTTLTNAIGPASSDNSLLVADSLYRIVVDWSGQRRRDSATRGTVAAPISQTFWFKTDRIEPDPADAAKLIFTSTPPLPVRLDPWTLITTPEDGEKAYFGLEDVRLVFNTHDVDRLFAAYGKELRVRFQAASGNHPVATPTVAYPYPITPVTLQLVAATLVSPWEQAVAESIDLKNAQAAETGEPGSCVAVDESRERHSVLDIPIPLDPYMDYILDVECVPTGAPASATGPSVYRRHFSTGAFGTFEQFGSAVVASRPTARSSAPGGFEAIRTFFAGRQPMGSELDDQLRAHGIEPLAVPDRAQVVVFWEQSGSSLPQPAAVLIDATEPLRRSRKYPRLLTDTTGPENAQRWILEPREWLTLRDRSSAGVLAANGVIYAPGEQRALIVLAPGARGKQVTLDLVNLAFSDLAFLPQAERAVTVVDLPLAAAPWEES